MLRKFLMFALLLPLVAGADVASAAGNAANGAKLHAAYCTRCHDSSVYTRKSRGVNSLDQLIGQVESCNHLLQKPLSPAQLKDLVAYLNETYYRFK